MIKLPLSVKIGKTEDEYEIQYDGDGEDMVDKVVFSNMKRIENNKRPGGVLFIDECYDLKPSTNPEGKLILAEIMSCAEEYRDSVSIILAGYKDDIDNEIFSYNIGMASRFQTVYFEDFSEAQLGEIWKLMCEQKGFACHDSTSAIVRRRLVRKRRQGKGFGNAREVRNMFTVSAQRATSRYCEAGDTSAKLTIETIDVIGRDPSHSTQLQQVLKELDGLVGIGQVKTHILNIVKMSKMNYSKEIDGSEPDDIWLNKLFVGNPGTGKTTVAKIYGRVLNCLGLLSKDEVVYKTASDFMGSVVGGKCSVLFYHVHTLSVYLYIYILVSLLCLLSLLIESQLKTSNILKLCEGKTLIIDEAYGLNDSGGASYGRQVLDTLNEKVSGSPGEDRAVILIGYEDQLLNMLRTANPGLARRFDATNPMKFEDFSDNELFRIASDILYKKNMVNIELSVLMSMIDHVSQLRTLPNFGNAGAMELYVLDVIKRMKVRGGDTILKVDVGHDTAGDHMAILDCLENVGELKEKMRKLGDRVKIMREQGRDTTAFIENYMFLGTVTVMIIGLVDWVLYICVVCVCAMCMYCVSVCNIHILSTVSNVSHVSHL